MFIRLLNGLANVSNHTKCVLLNNQRCINQPILISLLPIKYSQEFHYYTLTVKLYRCVASCNTLNNLSNKVCIPNKTGVLNLNVFSMITGINESEILAKRISSQCKFKLDGTKFNSNQRWNNEEYRCECKKRYVCGRDYAWNPVTYNCENGKYLASILNMSTSTSDEIIDSYDEDTSVEAKSTY